MTAQDDEQIGATLSTSSDENVSSGSSVGALFSKASSMDAVRNVRV